MPFAIHLEYPGEAVVKAYAASFRRTRCKKWSAMLGLKGWRGDDLTNDHILLLGASEKPPPLSNIVGNVQPTDQSGKAVLPLHHRSEQSQWADL
jgi:hypothetical protein